MAPSPDLVVKQAWGSSKTFIHLALASPLEGQMKTFYIGWMSQKVVFSYGEALRCGLLLFQLFSENIYPLQEQAGHLNSVTLESESETQNIFHVCHFLVFLQCCFRT